MLRINDVYSNQGSTYRILSILPEQVVWVEIDRTSALPELVLIKDLVNLIEEGVCYITDDPHQNLLLQTPKDGSKAQLNRDESYELIKPHCKSPFILPSRGTCKVH